MLSNPLYLINIIPDRKCYFGYFGIPRINKCQEKTYIPGYQIVITLVDGNADRGNLDFLELFVFSAFLGYKLDLPGYFKLQGNK